MLKNEAERAKGCNMHPDIPAGQHGHVKIKNDDVQHEITNSASSDVIYDYITQDSSVFPHSKNSSECDVVPRLDHTFSQRMTLNVAYGKQAELYKDQNIDD